MTLSQSIEAVDELMHNTYTQEQKVTWLSALDAMVKEQLFDTHEQPPEVIFEGYDEHTPAHTALLVPAPYDQVYPLWLQAQIHYHNGEFGKYNQALRQYQAVLTAYSNHYHSTHLPKGRQYRYY